MNYTTGGGAEMQQQNPNPNSNFSHLLHTTNYSTNPYQQQPPTIDHHPQNTALFLPPPGVDAEPYVPPPANNVQYSQQLQYSQQQQQQAAVSYDAQQSGYYYYPADPNVNWGGGGVTQFGATPYAAAAAGVTTPNPATHPQRNNNRKKAPKKTKVVQSAWCEVCKVDCNSNDVLLKHKLGKKHLKNIEKLRAPPAPVPQPAPAIAVAPSPVIAAVPLQFIPLAGSSTPFPSGPMDKPVIGPEENPDKPRLTKSQKLRKKVAASRTQDLETKRRKVLEGGAAEDSVRACSVCNVVCNSETVFKYHIAGQKHAGMVKKQASMVGVVPAM